MSELVPRIWDIIDEEERDIGRQWHRAQLLARIFGRWVGWHLEWQREQDELDMRIIEPFQHKRIKKLQRKWFVKSKEMIENRINMTIALGLAQEFNTLYSYESAIKKLLLHCRSVAPKRFSTPDLTHIRYYYRVFLRKLQKKCNKKCSNYKKLKGIMSPDTLHNHFSYLKDCVMKTQVTRRHYGMVLQHYRRYQMNKVYYKIVRRIKIKLHNHINHRNHIEIITNYKKLFAMKKLYTYSRRQSSDYSEHIQHHNAHLLRKGLQSLKLFTQRDSQSASVTQYYDNIFQKNQNKKFILRLIRLQYRRLLQCDSEYRTEQYFNCNWRFRRIGTGIDIWRYRCKALKYQGYSMKISMKHYQVVIKSKALPRWQHYGHHIAKRGLRCRVMAQFHHDVKLMTKYLQQFGIRNDARKSQQQDVVKSIWFWRAFRGIQTLRTWRSFVKIERASRAVTIDHNQLTQASQEGSSLWNGSVMLHSKLSKAGEYCKASIVQMPKCPVVPRTDTDHSYDVPSEHLNTDVIRALARAPPRTTIPDFIQSPASITAKTAAQSFESPIINESKGVGKDINKLLIARDIIQFVSEMQKDLRNRTYTNTINIH